MNYQNLVSVLSASASSPGPCVRKIVLVGILWTLKFLCRNLQFKWCWIEKKLSPIFSEPFRPVLCKLDMTSLYSWWMTTKCLQFDSPLFESNIINAFTTAVYITFWLFQGMKEWTKYLKQDTRVFISETSFLFSSYLLHLLMNPLWIYESNPPAFKSSLSVLCRFLNTRKYMV